MPRAKTAISLDRSVLEKADSIARDLQVSRSRVFSLGVEELDRRLQNQRLLEQINAVYDEVPDAEEQHRLRAMKRLHRRAVVNRQ